MMPRQQMEPLGWVCHVMTTHFPDGRIQELCTYPSHKLKTRTKLYCKYCYQSHRSWWQMKPTDYSEEDIILCGHCGYTSLKEIASL
jgi:DNA-directed RNA polymerase subunit M/transcription elongation factor TFIIS